MASNEPPHDGTTNLPRGLIGRRGLPTGRGTRLPSIRAPRDLTLGGVPKKTFTPNIPIRREKTKEIDTDSENKSKSRDRKSDKDRSGRGRDDRGRGRRQGRNDYIQSASIFEQGPANRTNIRGSGGGGGSSMRREDYASSSKLDKSRAYHPSEVDEENIKLLLEDDEDDDDEIADKNCIPVVLPMRNVGNFLKKEIREENFDDEVVHIKQEPDEELMILNDSDINVKEELADSPMKNIKPLFKSTKVPQKKLSEKITNCKDIFCNEKNSENGELLFFQLPDYFPGVAPSEDVKPKIRQEPVNTATNTTTPLEDEEAKEKKPTFTLADLPEGFIGKLQILKSGKTRLILGNIPFVVEVGSVGNFLQDLASIKVEDGNGDMAILGQIRHRLVCCPDIENYISR